MHNQNDSSHEHEPVLDKVVEILRKIAEILAQNSNQVAARHEIVSMLAEGMKVDECSLFIYNPNTNLLELAATHALTSGSAHQTFISIEEGLAGYTFRSQQTLNIANHRFHPKYKIVDHVGEEIFNSFLGIPLTCNGIQLGVLIIQNKAITLLNMQTVDAFRSIATQLANMIYSTDMIEKMLKDDHEQNHDQAPSKIQSLNGTSVSTGVAFGYAYRVKTAADMAMIPNESITDIEAELALLVNAVTLTKQQTIQLEERSLTLLTEADSAIFTTHLLMLDDHALMEHIRESITQRQAKLETAIRQAYLFFEDRFLKLTNPVFRERINDLKDLLLRLLENIDRLRNSHITKEAQTCPSRDMILLAEELLPSELMRLPIDSIRGIACEKGSITSHAAILAKALDIPALMGISGLMKMVEENQELLVDADAGVLYIEPPVELKTSYQPQISMIEARRLELTKDTVFHPLPAITADNYQIVVRANLSLLNEIPLFHDSRAQGIGLYRSEFLFMMRETLPSEQDQYNIYSKIIKAAGREAVTIRALDVGADKPVPCVQMAKEENPALGIRGVRLLRQREDILTPHIRAILRAGASGNLRILLPMIATPRELFEMRAKISEIAEKLSQQNIPHAEKYKLGMMLETPSMIYDLEQALDAVDFISVGTNDLTQYIFAADRGNDQLSYLTNPLNPTFLRILRRVSQICHKETVPISICGEMAGNRLAIPILVGLGYYELSVAPKRLENTREVVSTFTIDTCQKIAKEVCLMTNTQDVEDYMNDVFASNKISTLTTTLQRIQPEFVHG